MNEPTPEQYWRGLILFGVNVSTYKLGLGQLLLRYGIEGRDTIPLEDLSHDFLQLYQRRCEDGKPQMGQKGRITCVEKEIQSIRHQDKDPNDAASTIGRIALSNMVLQKFNNLLGRSIPEPFYSFQPGDDSITLNSNMFEVSSSDKLKELYEGEILSRWDLLEHAFERTCISPLVAEERLIYLQNWQDRKNLTPLVPLLQGYQVGRCFYCGEPLHDVHIDHVIPYSAVGHNEVWNLVLTDCDCNSQKQDSMPSWKFLDKLMIRNEYYIASSHPLKDEIIRSLGKTSQQRKQNVKKQFDDALAYKGRYWRGNEKYDPSKDEDYLFWVRLNAQRL